MAATLSAQNFPFSSNRELSYLCVFSVFAVPCLFIGVLGAPKLFDRPKSAAGSNDAQTLTIEKSLDPVAVKMTRRIFCVMLVGATMFTFDYAHSVDSIGLRILLSVQVWSCLVFAAATYLQHANNMERAMRLRHLIDNTAVGLKTRQKNTLLNHEEAIAESLALLSVKEKLIADYSSELLLALSPNWNILESNHASWTMLGYLPQELSSHTLLSLSASPESSSNRLREQTTPPTTPAVKETELCLVSKSGELVDVSVRLEWSERQQVYFALVRNISAAKQIERAKSQFLSMISHDVRSPLLSVLLSMQSIADGHYGETTSTVQDVARRAERNAIRIIDLVGEIIDLQGYTSAKPELAIEKSDLGDIVLRAIEQVCDTAAHLEITISNLTGETPLQCDTKRIARTVVNLLSNAIKYAGKGSLIEISTSTEFEFAKVKVKDNGPGIPENLHAAIFDQYFHAATQASNASVKLPSSGLGLPICKLYVEAHGGEIGVISKPGEGCTFWFTLPLRQKRAPH